MDREISSKSKVTVEEERGNGGGISRRSFIKGVGGVAAAATVLGLSGLKLKALAQPIPASITFPKKKLLEAYRKMQLIRQGEAKVREIQINEPGVIRAFIHSSEGEEACCVGVAMAMKLGHDYLGHTHRSHGYPIAMGVDMKAWMAELFGKVTGTNKGRGGSMHIADPKKGMLGAISIIAQGIPHAVGAAYSAVLRGTDQVALATCGEGATNQGAWHESLNLATVWELPVVFVVHNNQWRISIPANWETAPIRRGKDLSVRAAAYAIPGVTADGMDIWAVYKAAKWCIDRARQGKGPSLLELVTYRTRSHADITAPHEVLGLGIYKGWFEERKGEYEYWMKRNAIKRFEKTVLEGGDLTKAELTSVEKEVATEIEEAVEFSRKSPFENPEEAYKDIYV